MSQQTRQEVARAVAAVESKKAEDIVILEGLNLNSVPAGEYTLFALPLNLQDTDGAPTRVILTN